MQCPNCSAVVREGSKFCVKCGTLLRRASPSCGHAADDLFFAQCGASLQASQPQTNEDRADGASKVNGNTTSRASPDHRHVLRHGGIKRALDPTRPERAEGGGIRLSVGVHSRDQSARWHGRKVHRRWGALGFAAAHEDDPARAVRAGLAIEDRVGSAAAGVTLQARAGIASGVVVVGNLVREGATQENAASARPPTLARCNRSPSQSGGDCLHIALCAAFSSIRISDDMR
jgi:zinc-ribbon domain